jgi:hypothetical protein
VCIENDSLAVQKKKYEIQVLVSGEVVLWNLQRSLWGGGGWRCVYVGAPSSGALKWGAEEKYVLLVAGLVADRSLTPERHSLVYPGGVASRTRQEGDAYD